MPDKLELKNDLVFQKIFGVQKNSKITAHFLSLILGKEIHDISLDTNKRMLRTKKDSKTCRLDIRAKFNDGEDCNIELQILPFQFMPERMLEYWAVMYDNKIHCGEGYDVLKPSFSILIANYRLEQLKEIEKYHTVWNLRETDFPNKIISKNIEMHVLEIPKIKDFEIFQDELAQWLKFIENPENKEVKKLMKENIFLKQAKKEFAYLKGKPDYQRVVESRAGWLRDMYTYGRQLTREGREEGLAEGRAEGRAEGHAEGLAEGHAEGHSEGLAEGEISGAKKKQKEIAKKMKSKNMPLDEIIELTGLSKEEIEKL